MMNQENETKRMTVVIAGRSYPVKVSHKEELILPSIEKEINDQIRQIQMTYKDRDMQDCISMVLLTKSLESNNNPMSEESEIGEKLDNINSLLESSL